MSVVLRISARTDSGFSSIMRALLLSISLWAQTSGKIAATSSGMTKSRPLRYAYAFAIRQIASAILTVLEKQKLVAEGAGAVGIAAAMYHKVNTEGRTVCALLSGGNVDVTMLERILTRGLAKEGRTVTFSTVLPDQPHALASFLSVVSSMGANVLDVNHERRNTKAAIGSCVVNLSLETRDKAHIQEIFGCLRRKGYTVEEK